MNDEAYIPFDKVVLEKLEIGCQIEISKHLLDARVEIVDYIAHYLAIEAHGYVWAERESVRHQEVKYPADWWQAWKECFRFRLPKWFLKRHPIKYTVVVLDVKAIYPTFRPQLKDNQAVLLIQRSQYGV